MRDVIDILHDHQRPRPHVRRGEGRLTAGMAAADDDNVKSVFGKNLHAGTEILTCGWRPRS